MKPMIRPRKPVNPTTRVIIPVMMREGKLVPYFGGELPKLREGAAIDLVTEEGDFEDRSELERFNKEEIREILPAGSEMFAVITQRDNAFHEIGEQAVPPYEVAKGVVPDPPHGANAVLVAFKLIDPLHLHLRGTRKPELMPCMCDLGIEGVDYPESVNQAYTRLSERYEPWRASHTGNVFTKVYYRISGSSPARPLEHLRKHNSAMADEALFYPPLVPPPDENPSTPSLE